MHFVAKVVETNVIPARPGSLLVELLDRRKVTVYNALFVSGFVPGMVYQFLELERDPLPHYPVPGTAVQIGWSFLPITDPETLARFAA